jgi:hypothetical protein
MNTTLQMNPVHIAQTKPSVRIAVNYLGVFTFMARFFSQILNTRDDPAAIRYIASKGNEGWD